MKTKTVGSIPAFLDQQTSKRIPLVHKAITIPLVLSPVYSGGRVFAAEEYTYSKGDMTKEVAEMFEPISDLMIAAGLPFAGVMFAVAAYHFMIGRFPKGKQLLFGTALGYLILNLIGFGLKLLSIAGHKLG